MTKKNTILLVLMLVSIFFTQAQVIETQRLVSDDIETGDNFGEAVAISGNYAIIGSLGDDENGVNSGSAYIYYNNAGTWEQYQKITASDGQTNDFFGVNVTISGDYAFACSLGANSYAGKVYAFYNDAGTWTETDILIASDTESSDLFGESMVANGDYVIIGALGNDDFGSQSGSAYIFQNNSGNWTEITKLTASDGAESDQFGTAVSIYGDYAIVGADHSENHGKIYAFYNNSGTWEQTQIIESADISVGDFFGVSVCVYDEYLAIGASSKSDNGTWSGAAYVFQNNSGTWEEQQKLTASDAASMKHFGNSINIIGDTLIVGSKGNRSFTPYVAGSAYLFKNDSGEWDEKAKLTASDIGLEDYFGNAVSFSNSYAFVGSPLTDSDFEDAGAVYIYEVVFTNIILQPISQEIINPGANIVFLVEAEGINLSYQWRKDEVNLINGGNISGSTTNELTITSATSDDVGIYDCVVSGDYGVIISEDAMLSDPLGISDISKQEIFIYPNPTNGKIYFKTTNSNIQQIFISDITGKRIIENIETQQNKIFDFSDFESGIYFIIIQTEKEILKAKIIKR